MLKSTDVKLRQFLNIFRIFEILIFISLSLKKGEKSNLFNDSQFKNISFIAISLLFELIFDILISDKLEQLAKAKLISLIVLNAFELLLSILKSNFFKFVHP